MAQSTTEKLNKPMTHTGSQNFFRASDLATRSAYNWTENQKQLISNSDAVQLLELEKAFNKKTDKN